MSGAVKIKRGEEARKKIWEGVLAVADAVSSTLGPRGRTVITESKYGGSPRITKDGVSVAKSIDLKDRESNLGAQLVKEVSSKTANVVGDGTTTATVLAREIYKRGSEAIAAGMDPMDIRRGIDAAVCAVKKRIDDKKEIIGTDFEKLQQIATVSANHDKEIGTLIAEAVGKVGLEGVITVEEAKGIETELDTVEGMQFDRGYLSPYFVTNSGKGTCEFENPLILFVEKKIDNIKSFLPVLEKVNGEGRPLLVIADDVESDLVTTLVLNKLRIGLKVCAVKSPGFGDKKTAMMEDMAILTGGTFISESAGHKLEDVTIDMMGSAEKIVVSKDSSTIIGGKGSSKSIEERCVKIRSDISNADSEYDKEKLQERLAKLSSGVVIIKIGAATETEVKERKDRVEDALHATRAAADGGIVPGGGVALLNGKKALDSLDVSGESYAYQFGVNIIKDSINAPCKQIAENAGLDGSVVAYKVESQKDESYGYDARNGEYGNMVDKGIIDPASVVKESLSNAASMVSLILGTEVIIVEDNDEKDGSDMPMGGGMPPMGGMPGMM
jgi:chaperonin GroEL